MEVIIKIINFDPPHLNKFLPWSQDFRNFVNDCLNKDMDKRPTANELLIKHKKFFDQAENNEYVK